MKWWKRGNGRYMVGSLEATSRNLQPALMGAKAIAGGCALSDPISTDKKKTKKLEQNNFHHGSVETTMLLMCFPPKSYPQV